MCVILTVTTVVTLTVVASVTVSVLASTTVSPTGSSSSLAPAGVSTVSGGKLLDDLVRARTVSCGEVAGIVEDGAFVFKVSFSRLSFFSLADICSY